MRYCTKCGDDAHAGECDPVALNAMKRNPFLSLLMNADGSPNPTAPVILGRTPTVAAPQEDK